MYSSCSFLVQTLEQAPHPSLLPVPPHHLDLRDQWVTWLTKLACSCKATLLGLCAFLREVKWPEAVALAEVVAGADEVVDNLV